MFTTLSSTTWLHWTIIHNNISSLPKITITHDTEQEKLLDLTSPSSNIFFLINPLPDVPILGSSSSAANKDMVAKKWTYGNTCNYLLE